MPQLCLSSVNIKKEVIIRIKVTTSNLQSSHSILSVNNMTEEWSWQFNKIEELVCNSRKYHLWYCNYYRNVPVRSSFQNSFPEHCW